MSADHGIGAEGAETPAAPETTQAPETTPAAPPPSPDFDRIYERMDQMSAQQQQLAEQFGQAFAEPEEEPLYYDDEGELTEDGIRNVVGAYVDERLEAALAPRERAAAIESRDNEWEALKAQFPELAEDRELANAVIGNALAWAQNHNPELINRREFVDVIEWQYKIHKYDEYAAQQRAAEPSVVLESAAGAAQPTKSQGIDWQKRVMDAASQQTRI